MIYVTKNSGGGYIIDLTNEEIQSLVYVLKLYLLDMDANDGDNYYDEAKELYDKISSAQ